MSTQNILYNEIVAAGYLGGASSPISVRTMQRWRLEGNGPKYIKLGRLVRYRQADLDLFLEENICSSTSMNNKTLGC